VQTVLIDERKKASGATVETVFCQLLLEGCNIYAKKPGSRVAVAV
jgi:hypothetical protein